jgi:heat shock protein HtpX
MSAAHIETDRGLSVRMVITGLGLLVLYLLIGTLLFALRLSVGLIVIIELGFIVGQYWFSDKIAMFSMRAREVTPQEEPQLHAMVDRLAALAGIPKPKVGISEMDMPNAFATGRNPSNSVVVVTRGLQNRLPDEEIEAVLSHEISHVIHRDVAVMTIASSVGMLAGVIARMAMWGAMFAGGGRDDRDGESLVLLELVTWVVSIAIYFVSYLLTMALSRYRELAADRSGAILIGKPMALASALQRITGDMARIPTTDLRRVDSMNAFFFTPALAKGSLGSLFSTHPSLQVRLDQLMKLERDLNGQA